MKIAVFFTYDYKLSTLINSGLLERELKIYKYLNKKYGVNFKFFTYDINELKTQNNFEFIPIYKKIKRSNNKYIRLFYSLYFPYKIRKEVIDCDVIHQHQLHGAWVTLILKLITKKPLLIRTGYDAYQFSMLNNEKLTKKYFNKFITKLSLKHADLYTVTSKEDYVFLTNKFKKIKKITIVPNWIEKKEIIAKDRHENKILMVGRIEKQKNYSDAIQFLDINKNHLTIDIVGNGQEKDLINNLSIEKDINIKFLGNMEHQKLTELYHSYEYFLSTSYFEGNPKSILEALNSGCIVFASNIPSHRELIRDELNGFLFSNISELSKKFDIIQKNTLFKKKVSQNAIKSVEKNIIENIVDTMYFDYENLNLVNNLK